MNCFVTWVKVLNMYPTRILSPTIIGSYHRRSKSAIAAEIFLRGLWVIWWRMLLKESHSYATILLNMEEILIGNRFFTLFHKCKAWPFLVIDPEYGVANKDRCRLWLHFWRIYLMGQSAGAHIAACTLLEQAIKEAGEGESTSWSVSQLKAYFGLSGG